MSVATPMKPVSSPGPAVRQAWQHYRATRFLLLFVLFVSLGMQAALILFAFLMTSSMIGLPVTSLQIIRFTAAAVYGLTAPAIIVCREMEAGTRDRLRMLPGRWTRWAAVLIGWHVVTTLLIVFLAGLACRLGGDTSTGLRGFDLEWLANAAAVTLIIAMFGLISALVSRRAVVALGIGTGITATFIALIAMTELWSLLQWAPLALPATIALAAWLVRRWFSVDRPFVELNLAFAGSHTTDCPRGLVDTVGKVNRTQTTRELTTIAWRERRSRLIWLLSSLCLALSPMIFSTRAMVFSTRALVAIPVFTFVCGLACFATEQHRKQFRFHADRGVAPIIVWLGKLRVWLPRAVIGPAILLAILYWRSDSVSHAGFTATEFCLLAFATFAIGQACSLLMQNPVVAAVVGLACLSALAIWCDYIQSLNVPISWTALLVTIFGFWLSWRCCSDWLNQRLGKPTLIRSVSALFAVAATLYLATSVYRITEIPAVHADFAKLSRQLDGLPAHEQRTASYPRLRKSQLERQRLLTMRRGANQWGITPPPLRELTGEVQPCEFTEDAIHNGDKFVELCQALCNFRTGQLPPLLPAFEFQPFYKVPIPWEQLPNEQQEWVTNNNKVANALCRTIENNQPLYFRVPTDQLFGNKELATLSSASIPAASTNSPGWQTRKKLEEPPVVHAGRYLGILLIELEGARLHAEGDLDAARKHFDTAIRGLWKCVASDYPGQDLIRSYKFAGRIIRRIGELEFHRAAQMEEPNLIRLQKLVESRPRPHEVSAWLADARKRSASGGNQYLFDTGSLNFDYVFNKVAVHQVSAGADLFTFGHRTNRLIEWMHHQRLTEIHAAAPSLKKWLHSQPDTGANEWLHQLMDHETPADQTMVAYRRHAYATDGWIRNRPYTKAWLLAEQDLIVDLLATEQLVNVARVVGPKSNPREQVREFIPQGFHPRTMVRGDAWGTMMIVPGSAFGSIRLPFEWYPKGMYQHDPTPCFTYAIQSSSNNQSSRWRKYPIPTRYLREEAGD